MWLALWWSPIHSTNFTIFHGVACMALAYGAFEHPKKKIFLQFIHGDDDSIRDSLNSSLNINITSLSAEAPSFLTALRWFWRSPFSHCLSSVGGTLMHQLSDVLAAAGVQETFIDKLREDGWNQDLFAMSAPTLEKFELELRDMSGDLYDITTSVQRSALKLAWSRCQPTTPSGSVTASPAAMPQTDSTATHSWSETYPPKLTSQVVTELKQKFRRNYPAEVLLPENTPSIRLLSLIHHQKLKGEYKWVPWKYRLSQAKADEITAGKPNRIAKAEGLHLHSLLVDSPRASHRQWCPGDARPSADLWNFFICDGYVRIGSFGYHEELLLAFHQLDDHPIGGGNRLT